MFSDYTSLVLLGDYQAGGGLETTSASTVSQPSNTTVTDGSVGLELHKLDNFFGSSWWAGAKFAVAYSPDSHKDSFTPDNPNDNYTISGQKLGFSALYK